MNQTSQTQEDDLQAELERLAYSAYLLTLDPGVALSVVMTAIDRSLEEIDSDPGLLERIVELSLEQLQRESGSGWDGEASVMEAVLYGYSAAINSPALQSLKDLSDDPIVLLDSVSRIAFVLHHVLGYRIREAAVKTHMSEQEFRTQLRSAYLQLAPLQSGQQDLLMRAVDVSALA